VINWDHLWWFQQGKFGAKPTRSRRRKRVRNRHYATGETREGAGIRMMREPEDLLQLIFWFFLSVEGELPLMCCTSNPHNIKLSPLGSQIIAAYCKSGAELI